MSALAVDGGRLLADLDALSAIGRRGRGVERIAFGPDDVRAREWLAERLEEAGLEARIDGIGNVHGRWPSPRAVLAGSHVDSVARGGRLDGALGVVAALEAARALRAAGACDAGVGLDVVAFADEEGTFRGTLGSRAFCGEVDDDELAAAGDAAGRSLGDALAAAGWAGRPLERLDPARHVAYLELHIEQGPVLDRAGERLGVVTGIVGMRRFEVVFEGRADHAGTTPPQLRRDAGAAAVRYATAFLDAVARAGGPESVGNVGAVRLWPGAGNVVPERASVLVEYRDRAPERLRALDAAVEPLAAAAAAQARVEVAVTEVVRMAGVAMDPELVAALGRAAEACGAPARTMPSGAGHDAMVVGRHLPSGMLFAPSIGGRSHCEEEETDPADLVLAARTLATAIAAVADRAAHGAQEGGTACASS